MIKISTESKRVNCFAPKESEPLKWRRFKYPKPIKIAVIATLTITTRA